MKKKCLSLIHLFRVYILGRKTGLKGGHHINPNNTFRALTCRLRYFFFRRRLPVVFITALSDTIWQKASIWKLHLCPDIGHSHSRLRDRFNKSIHNRQLSMYVNYCQLRLAYLHLPATSPHLRQEYIFVHHGLSEKIKQHFFWGEIPVN